MLLCFVAGAWAQDTEVTFVLNDPGEIEALGIALPEAGQGTTVDFMSKDGVNIVVTDGTTSTRIFQGSGKNAGKYDFRIYNGGTLAIDAGNIINYVKKVEFAGTGLENLSAEGYSDGVWTGCSMQPLFTATGTAVITSIKVTYGDPPALLPPSISGTTPFIGSTTVSINAEAGTVIQYTTDGSDPETGTVKVYTEPFTINETTTVKAIAILAEDENTKSDIATKTFTAIPGYDKLSDVNALANNTVFGYTGEAQVVANVSNKYIYVQDASASSLIYQAASGLELPTGSTIAANWNAKVSIYNKLFEIVPTSELSTKGSIVPVTYPMAHAEDVTADNINQVMKFRGVTFTKGEGKNLNIDGTVVGYNQFNITIPEPDAEKTYDIVGAVGRYNDNIQFWPISITSSPEDIVVAPAEGSNIYMEVETAKAGKNVKDIYVYLEPGKKYTISQPIQAPAAFVIMGAAPGTDPSTIDGSTAMAEIDATNLSTATDPTNLTGPVVQMSETPAVEPDGNGFYPLSDVGFINVKITNLKGQLFYANKQKYAISTFHVDYCNIHMAGGSKTLIDTNGGGVIGDLDMAKNTIWAEPAHSGQLYSSQSGQKATEAGFETQKFGIERNTFYNISYTKNVCTHRQANQTWMEYFVQNNVFINTGKNGQAIKGLNGGQGGPNPTWKVNGNAFNFDGADTSAAESTGDADEPVQNSLAGVFAFTDAANGDFNGVFKGQTAEAPAKYPGDPRWTYTYEAPVKIYIIGDMNNWDRTALTEMAFNETTQAYEYEYTPNTTAYFAIATKQLTEEEANADEDWSNFNANYRYAIGAGDQPATLNEAVALQKVNGAIVLKPVKESTSYKISVAKDLSTITIAGEAAPEPEATYTVVGAFYYGDPTNEVAIFGTVWDVSNTANDLEKQTDGTYKKVYENVTFEHDGNITFKIAENHAWDVNYGWTPSADNPNGNAEYYVAAPATGATMTITFDPSGTTPEDKVKISVEGIPTGINGIDADTADDNAPIYNLAGQKVTKAYKGVVIQNGKKIYQK